MNTHPPSTRNGLAALYGLAAYATFSTHDVFIKQLGAVYSPFQIVFFSALLSFPFITLVIIGDQKPGTLRPAHPWWMALRSVTGAVSAICAFYAFSKLPLAEVYAFIFAAPLIITLLAIPILGETVRLRRGLAVVMGLVGVLIVLRPGTTEISLGHVAALMAAFAGALSAIVVRKIGAEERGVVMILYPMMANLLIAAVALPFVYVDVRLVDLGMFAVVAAMVLVAMGAGGRAHAVFTDHLGRLLRRCAVQRIPRLADLCGDGGHRPLRRLHPEARGDTRRIPEHAGPDHKDPHRPRAGLARRSRSPARTP
jgi:drug/metabolite transporter (DMT)-like permease